jgi:hypothetical protein
MLAPFFSGRPSALEIRAGTFRALYLDSEEVLVESRISNPESRVPAPRAASWLSVTR